MLVIVICLLGHERHRLNTERLHSRNRAFKGRIRIFAYYQHTYKYIVLGKFVLGESKYQRSLAAHLMLVIGRSDAVVPFLGYSGYSVPEVGSAAFFNSGSRLRHIEDIPLAHIGIKELIGLVRGVPRNVTADTASYLQRLAVYPRLLNEFGKRASEATWSMYTCSQSLALRRIVKRNKLGERRHRAAHSVEAPELSLGADSLVKMECSVTHGASVKQEKIFAGNQLVHRFCASEHRGVLSRKAELCLSFKEYPADRQRKLSHRRRRNSECRRKGGHKRYVTLTEQKAQYTERQQSHRHGHSKGYAVFFKKLEPVRYLAKRRKPKPARKRPVIGISSYRGDDSPRTTRYYTRTCVDHIHHIRYIPLVFTHRALGKLFSLYLALPVHLHHKPEIVRGDESCVKAEDIPLSDKHHVPHDHTLGIYRERLARTYHRRRRSEERRQRLKQSLRSVTEEHTRDKIEKHDKRQRDSRGILCEAERHYRGYDKKNKRKIRHYLTDDRRYPFVGSYEIGGISLSHTRTSRLWG